MVDRTRSVAAETVPHGVLPGWRSAAVLALWLLLVAAGNSFSFFRATPGQPPLTLLLAIALPPLLFCAVYRASPAFRDFILGLDLRFLTATQCWRVIGGSFLAVDAQGLLPGVFAYPAGYGDLFVGGFALVALVGLERGVHGWRQRLLWLNVFGLLDFVGAVGTGLLAGDGPLGLLQGPVSVEPLMRFPLVYVPTFLVPLWILVHMASLLQLRHLATADGTRQALRRAPA